MAEFPFLRLSNILLFVFTTFCLFFHLLIGIGVVSSFCLLQVMLLRTLMCKYPFQVPAFDSSGCIPRSGLAGSRGGSMFYFWRNHCTVFHSGRTIFLPTSRTQRSQFLHILTLARHFLYWWCACLFSSSHPNGRSVISHFGFDAFAFP